MKAEPKFYVASKGHPDEGPFTGIDYAIAFANACKANRKTVRILRDSCGTDHPANAGKRFLYMIIN